MTILLTGATGFIGRHVCALLAHEGATVLAFGRQAPVTEQSSDSVRWICGDLASGVGLTDIPWDEVDAVIHLAAAGVKASCRDWPTALAVNVVGTQRLLTAIAGAGRVPTVFLARTFYEHLIKQAPALLDNPYIATKAAASELGRVFANKYTGKVVFGTFFQVYGPGDDPGNVLSYAAREFAAGRQATFGSGLGQRDWIHIVDAARAVQACLSGDATDYDIGSGQLRTIREMVEELHRLIPVAPAPLFDSTRDRQDVTLTAFARDIPATWHPQFPPPAGLATFLQKS